MLAFMGFNQRHGGGGRRSRSHSIRLHNPRHTPNPLLTHSLPQYPNPLNSHYTTDCTRQWPHTHTHRENSTPPCTHRREKPTHTETHIDKHTWTACANAHANTYPQKTQTSTQIVYTKIVCTQHQQQHTHTDLDSDSDLQSYVLHALHRLIFQSLLKAVAGQIKLYDFAIARLAYVNINTIKKT